MSPFAVLQDESMAPTKDHPEEHPCIPPGLCKLFLNSFQKYYLYSVQSGKKQEHTLCILEFAL